MKNLFYPCGCEFEIFRWNDSDRIEYQVESDGFACKLCEKHKDELK